MALSVADYAQVSDFQSTSTPKSLTSLDWSSGDRIYVFGGLADGAPAGAAVLSTPTNANLTFSLLASVTAGNENESRAYLWEAVAGSSQTAQTISCAATGTARNFGHIAYVVTGSPSGTANITSNQTESAMSLTVSAGSIVLYWFSDWFANTSNQTATTGSGTATERVDGGDGSNWGYYSAQWVGTSATTASFGVTSYTGTKVSHIAVEILAAAAGDGTATPAAIAVVTTIPAATRTAGDSGAPAAISAPISVPAVTASNSDSGAPTAIAMPITLPAPTPLASSTTTPAAIAVPVTIPAATASGSTSGTATPAALAVTVSIPQATAQNSDSATPAVISVPVTIAQATASNSDTAAPDAIAAVVTLPAASASGSNPGTATPAAIAAIVTLPAATPLASSTVTPGVIAVTVDVPQATRQGGATASPAVIPVTVSIPAASASGATAGTATPAAIAVNVSIPAPTLTFGYVVSPATIQVAISLGAVVASGLVPDAHPITFTVRDRGHTLTVIASPSSVTVREQRSLTAREQN